MVVIAPQKCHETLRLNLNGHVDFIEMPELKSVLKGLRTHSDMGMHMTPKGLVIEPSIFDEMKHQLLKIGFSSHLIHCGEIQLKQEYPYDIAFNCVAVGDHFFYHPMTDPKIISIYKDCGFRMHLIKQGYAKCSTLIVNSNAVITEDLNLYKNYFEAGIETLLIPKGDILLEGFEYGFIGGASGRYCDQIFLNGSLRHHRFQNDVLTFIKGHHFQIVELHDGPLEDCGSIFIFEF